MTLHSLTLPNVQITQLYMKWNKKLELSIKDIHIKENSSNNKTFNLDKSLKNLSYTSFLPDIFDKIDIKKIRFQNTQATYYFDDKKGALLKFHNQHLRGNISLSYDSDNILISINSFQDISRKIDLNAEFIFDKEQNIYSRINTSINKEIQLKIYAYKSMEKIFYNVESNHHIKSIRHLLDIIHFDKDIRYWVDDAIDTSYVKIKKAYGWIDLKETSNAYKNIYVDADLEKLNYTYNKKLDAIHSQYTQLEFKNGILYIRPKNAYSYNQYLGNSVVSLDFTQKNILLDIKLLFSGVLNKDILGILQAYKVTLPFYQHTGTIDTNLDILIKLRGLSTNVRGTFTTKEANFDYLGLNLDIYDANISLNNSNVLIDDMRVNYKDIASSKVKVKYDTSKAVGELDFNLTKVIFNEQNLSLNQPNLHVKYNIKNGKYDLISIANSSWKYFDKNLSVDALKIPLDFKNLILKIPTTKVAIDPIAKIYVSGISSIKDSTADLDVDLVQFDYKNTLLNNPKSSFKVNYNKFLSIKANSPIKLKKDDNNISLTKTYITFKENNLYFNTNVKVNQNIFSDLHCDYNLNSNEGMLYLNNTNIYKKNYGNLLLAHDPLNIVVQKKKDAFIFSSQDIDSSLKFVDNSWIFNISSLEKLSKYSPILRKYHITKGTFKLSKENDNKYFNFHSNLYYPYKFLANKNDLIDEYTIDGKVHDESYKSDISINNRVKITLEDNITVNAHDIGFDINELLKVIHLNNNNTSNSFKKKISFNAQNSFLYISKNRHVLADDITLNYQNKNLDANLSYKDGHANFQLIDDNIKLTGENFNDKFMENLFALSKFHKGKLYFFLKGTLEKYHGSMFIYKTTVKKYKLLNNILAFVNTVPSLVTFSLPGYNKHGLGVDYAYMNFQAYKNDYNISDIYLESKEVNILGRGYVNILKNKIDLTLNLKTDLASTVSKIPVVGYILFDKDSMSTSLKVEGKLSNPKVKSLIASEIIVAPLNIIKRTLLLPFQIFEEKKK